MSPRVVLVGPMGAGKSAVGAIVAAELGLELHDSDADVEAAAGVSVAQLFAGEGEAAFRRRERDAVCAALVDRDGVLSLGGGAVLDPATRADLAAHHVVLLDVSWEHATLRLDAGAGRPLLAGDPQQRWTSLAAARRALYEQVATAVVSTDGRSAAEVARAVLATLPVPEPGRTG